MEHIAVASRFNSLSCNTLFSSVNIQNITDNRPLEVSQKTAYLENLLENMQDTDIHFSLQNEELCYTLYGSLHMNYCFCDSPRWGHFPCRLLGSITLEKTSGAKRNFLLPQLCFNCEAWVSHNLLPWLDLVQKSTLRSDFLITSTAPPHVGDIHDRPTWTYSDQEFWSVMVFVVGEKLFPSMQTTWSLRKYFSAVYHNSHVWKLEERLDQHPWFPRRYFVESTSFIGQKVYPCCEKLGKWRSGYTTTTDHFLHAGCCAQ